MKSEQQETPGFDLLEHTLAMKKAYMEYLEFGLPVHGIAAFAGGWMAYRDWSENKLEEEAFEAGRAAGILQERLRAAQSWKRQLQFLAEHLGQIEGAKINAHEDTQG